MQTNMPREIKDIIRNVQQMDLPENGIADIRIKIQGGDVMDRPMFKKGGGANKFPDLSGDGKVTQKDILIGRGVIEKQEGGAVNPEQAIAQVEMAAEAEGEQLGLDYLAQQMGGIDMAEDAEGLINALRGNEMPISARRTELAEYVGEEDAMRTPESVLAMVQPTIMMTEEGAMNSGIGELMQQLTSDVEMATEGGAPTDMGQGVGALMMAGAPEQPVQQFAAGGAVQYFSDGTQNDPITGQSLAARGALMRTSALDKLRGAGTGTGDLQTYFDEYLPLYENLIRDSESEEDRRKDRALALAKAGFRFASGIGPKGQNIAGQPLLSQAAAAAIPAIDELGDIESRRRKEDTALRTLAAQSAIKAQDTATTRAQKIAELEYQAGVKLQDKALDLLLKDPKYKIVNVNVGDGKQVPLLVDENTGNYQRVDMGAFTATQSGELPSNLTNPKKESRLFNALADMAKGSVEEKELSRLDTLVDDLYPAETVIDGVKKTPTIPVNVLDMVNARLARGDVPRIQKRIIRQAQNLKANRPEALEAMTDLALNNFDAAVEANRLVAGVPEEDVLIDPDFDASNQYGLMTGVISPFNAVLTTFEAELAGYGAAGAERSAAVQRFYKDKGFLKKLISVTNRELLQAMGGTRLSNELKQITEQTEVLEGSGLTFDVTAKTAAEGILIELNTALKQAVQILEDNEVVPGSIPAADVNDAQKVRRTVPKLIRAYNNLLQGFDVTMERTPGMMPRMTGNVPLVQNKTELVGTIKK